MFNPKMKMRKFQIWIEAQRFLKSSDGLLIAIALRQDRPEFIVEVGTFRCQIHSSLHFGDSVISGTGAEDLR